MVMGAQKRQAQLFQQIDRITLSTIECETVAERVVVVEDDVLRRGPAPGSVHN